MNDPATFGIEDAVHENGSLVACSLSGRAFLSLGAELFALEPHLYTVRLVAVQPYIEELAACPHVARLRALSLRGNRLGDDRMKLLLDSPQMLALRELDLRGNNLSATMLAEVMAWAGDRCRVVA